jgi:hypothetical protein
VNNNKKLGFRKTEIANTLKMNNETSCFVALRLMDIKELLKKYF